MIRAFGAFAWGGDRKMFFGFLMVTYSSKRNTSLVFTGTLTLPGRGLMPMMSGGMVSLRPPVGACVVLAQEWTKIIGRKMAAEIITGMNFLNLVISR